MQISAEEADGHVRIWPQQHESMDPTCHVLTAQVCGGGGVMLWGMFPCHTLAP